MSNCNKEVRNKYTDLKVHFNNIPKNFLSQRKHETISINYILFKYTDFKVHFNNTLKNFLSQRKHNTIPINYILLHELF
jgi:hypothetical protein